MTKFPADCNAGDELSKEAYEIFTRHFVAVVRRAPESVAIKRKIPGGYESFSYGEAYRRIRGIALGLHLLGLRRGDRVAILSENRPEWALAYLGSYFAGTVVVPLDTRVSPYEWRLLIDDSETQAVFVSGMLAPELIAVLDGAGITKERIIVFDDFGDAGCGSFSEMVARGFLDKFDESSENPLEIAEVLPSDVAVLIYTSGTTGQPKGVPLTHANVMHELRGLFGRIYADSADSILCLLPLQHVMAAITNVLAPLYKGGYVVFADTLKRTEIIRALSETGSTILVASPQFFYMFHRHIQEELSRKPALARRIFRGMKALNRLCLRYLKLNIGKTLFARIHKNFGSRLRLLISGGSGIDAAVARDFHDMGFTFLQTYGLTETAGACTANSIAANVIGSVGHPLPGVEIKILSPNEAGIGEVLICGPIVTPGYYKNPEATHQAIRDGWFHSGDLGRLDAKGNLFIIGREKEVIALANGKNIYPEELEAYYLQCPYIRELAVIGMRGDDGRGESPHAVVVPNFEYFKSKKITNARRILSDGIAVLSVNLPKYKRLMSYRIQSEPLPRTTTKKPKRLEIRQMENGEQIAALAALSTEDMVLMESPAGRKVLACLRGTHNRTAAITPDMNLELDLGFDSMERVELLSGLEEKLDVCLSVAAASEIFTVRDLIITFECENGGSPGSSASAGCGWKTILSGNPADDEPIFRPPGPVEAVLKYLLAKILHYGLFKPLLRLEINGFENLPEKGPYLICPNHQSYIDPFVIIGTMPFRIFRRMFFVGYSVIFTGPVMKLVARALNIIPIDPDAHLLGAMKAGADGLRRGGILCIFPEGGRSFDGELAEFKNGTAILARELSAPMIPTAIYGAYEVWRRDSNRIRPHKVRIVYGKALMTAESFAKDPYQEDTDRLHREVCRLFDNLRSS